MKEKRKANNSAGITLIALVITIVVLLILAGVTISMIVGQNGILSNAQNSVIADAKSKEEEGVTTSALAAISISSSKGNIALENGYFNQELKNEFGEGKYLLEETEDFFTVTIVETGNSYEVDKFGNVSEQLPSGESEPGEAYAICLDNNEDTTNSRPMIFVREEEAPVVGETYESETYGVLPVTHVYTNFETSKYSNYYDTPWYYGGYYNVTSVVFEDTVTPISTNYWFYGFENASNMDLAKLDTSSVNEMTYMFYNAGKNRTTFTVTGLENWNISNVTNMDSMFMNAGRNSSSFKVSGLEKWDTSSVKSMFRLFSGAGNNAKNWNIGDLSNWDTSSVTDMCAMFSDTGTKSTIWHVGDLSRKTVTCSDGTTYIAWDTSSVTNMSSMFNWAGYGATSWNVGDLSGWNTSSVTNMARMFQQSGYVAETWYIGDNISNWDTFAVTNMFNMFYAAGPKATYSLDLSEWDVSNVTSYVDFNAFVKTKIIAPEFGI